MMRSINAAHRSHTAAGKDGRAYDRRYEPLPGMVPEARIKPPDLPSMLD